MAHVAKHTRAASGHLFKHYERAKDENGEYLKFGNQDIDPERSHLNYNLGPARSINQGDFVRQRCQDVYCFQRKDVNVMCSWIVTLPAEMKDAGNEKEFFEKTYDFLADRYGQDNVVSAFVHMDEISPHMHFAFVPVVPDKKRGLKVSAKERLSKLELKAFHGDLDKHLTQTMGDRYPGGILNGATIEGNRSIEELKRKSAADRLQQAEEQANEIVSLAKEQAGQLVKDAQAEVKRLNSDAKALREEIKGHNKALGSIGEIEEIGNERTLTGKVTMSQQHAATLKKHAKAAFAARAAENAARQTAGRLSERLKGYEGVDERMQQLEDDNWYLRKDKAKLLQQRDQARQETEDVKDVIRSDPQLRAAYNEQVKILDEQEQQRQQQERGHDWDWGR